MYQCLRVLKRFVKKRPDLHAMWLRSWDAYSHDCSVAPIPVGLVAKMVAQIGWSWPDFYHFSEPGRSQLPLARGLETWWHHELQNGLRLARWAAAAGSRLDMNGLDAPQGIDRNAIMALWLTSTASLTPMLEY